MKESQFSFEYTWADLQPIRALALVVLVAQVAGGAVGLVVHPFPHWFKSMWVGAAVITFPAFLVGLLVQARLSPGSLRENKVMVRRMGLIAAALTVLALAVPVLGFGRHSG